MINLQNFKKMYDEIEKSNVEKIIWGNAEEVCFDFSFQSNLFLSKTFKIEDFYLGKFFLKRAGKFLRNVVQNFSKINGLTSQLCFIFSKFFEGYVIAPARNFFIKFPKIRKFSKKNNVCNCLSKNLFNHFFSWR